MAGEVAPEIKLHVAEAIDSFRKETKADIEKAHSGSLKLFTVVTTIIGLVTALGVWKLAGNAITEGLKQERVQELSRSIQQHEMTARESVSRLQEFETKVKETGLLLPIGTIIPVHAELKELQKLESKGWYICDGNNGTPDLINRFIRGGKISGQKGGKSNTFTKKVNTEAGTDLNKHKHETPTTNWSSIHSFAEGHVFGAGGSAKGHISRAYAPSESARDYGSEWKLTNTPFQIDLNAHVHDVEILPEYFTVVYIMRVR